ncbi:polysaccharide deacetylase family protein [Candidatus Daviesbacteria bacterium]|nr:polysaccharide deacetylase family protein [Candidatus Daviesbacteria bacterium]
MVVLLTFLVGKFYLKGFIFRPAEMTQLPPDVKTLDTAKEVVSLKVPVLLYHYVEFVKDQGDTIRKSLNILPPVFDAEIKTLKDANYTFITPSIIPDILSGKVKAPAKPVILSFDDGYRDFYTDVFPILKKYNVHAVVYIVPGFINLPNNMTEAQLREIVKSGLVEIGAHTVHHAYLTGLPDFRARDEISQSKTDLEKKFNVKVVSFAYPYGAFNSKVIGLVKAAGFTTAVTTIPGIDVSSSDVYFIPRIRPGGRAGKSLLDLLGQSSFKPYN